MLLLYLQKRQNALRTNSIEADTEHMAARTNHSPCNEQNGSGGSLRQNPRDEEREKRKLTPKLGVPKRKRLPIPDFTPPGISYSTESGKFNSVLFDFDSIT